MVEQIMLQIIIKISLHYIKKGSNESAYAAIAETALDIATENTRREL